jgi:hypothetical protein
MDLATPGLAPTRDHHPVPRSRGGTRVLICCITCNNIKGDMGAAEWLGYRAAHPEWWLKPAPKQGLPRRRHVRFIKSPETPSTPMREPLEQLQLTRMIARGFDELTRREDD